MITYQEEPALLAQPETLSIEGVQLQTFRRSFEQICQGEDPWIALGNFMHQFFGQCKHLREELVRDPLTLSDNVSADHFRWAVFCAASVEHLCAKYDIPCPQWVQNPGYTLADPWFYAIGSDLPHVQEKLRITTPDEFTKRNIFCGNRTFKNKYEHEGRQGRRRSA